MDITTQSHLFTQLTNQSNLSLVGLGPFFKKKIKTKNPQTHFLQALFKWMWHHYSLDGRQNSNSFRQRHRDIHGIMIAQGNHTGQLSAQTEKSASPRFNYVCLTLL